jgi:hypothetical protein
MKKLLIAGLILVASVWAIKTQSETLKVTPVTQANPLGNISEEALKQPLMVIECPRPHDEKYDSVTVCNGVVCSTHYPLINEKKPEGFNMIMREIQTTGFNVYTDANCRYRKPKTHPHLPQYKMQL